MQSTLANVATGGNVVARR